MNKIVAFLLCFLVSSLSYSQSKNTFSLGRGFETLHNDFLSSYNLKGTNILNIRYENEKLKNNIYKTITGINLGATMLKFDYDFANKLEKGPYNLDLGLSVNKSYLFRLYQNDNFSIWSGLVYSIQSNFQAVSYNPIISSEITYYVFFNIGLSGGLSTSAQVQLNKISIQNTSSFFLINAMLYPNYAYDLPLPGNYAPNYFTLSSVNKRKFLYNNFQIDFPLYIKNKLVNSFSFSYLFNYENSSIKDIAIRKYEHIFSLGIIFKINKIDISVH